MQWAFLRACYACAFTIAFATSTAARAADVDEPAGELTLATAIAAALRSNPELAAGGHELSAAQGRLDQAGARPNPELSLEVENFAGSGTVEGVDALETTLSLSQVVELGGKRELRVSAAQADLDVLTIERRASELDVLAELTRRFVDVAAAQARIQVTAEATALAQQSFDAIAARVAAGRSPEAERSRARIVLTRARIEQRQAESQLQATRVTLSALWGSAAPRFTAARANLFDLPHAVPFEALVQRLEQSPDFLRFASDARLKQAELQLARAQSRPNLAFGLGVRRFEETNDTALVAGFSMALPLSDRNRGAIRVAQARLSQSQALHDAALLRVRAAVFALHQELGASQARVESLRNEALPQAQLALDQTRSGYERGRFSFLELATAQEDLLAIRAAAIDAAADYHRLFVEIERLTGETLVQTRR